MRIFNNQQIIILLFVIEFKLTVLFLFFSKNCVDPIPTEAKIGIDTPTPIAPTATKVFFVSEYEISLNSPL